MLTKAPKAVALKRRSSGSRRLAITKTRKPEGVDMLRALRDFVGCVDGTADLSTNKRHLANLGR